MADGPAGLRIAPQCYRDSKGLHAVGSSGMPESVMELLPWFVKPFLGGKQKAPPEGTKIEYQYVTSLPVATAIAQSWNTDFAEKCGDIVGEEMARFGVHLWLAPALNIHRSIRCGRNFEYFSEDPSLSGKFAAAITRGVQKHHGCGTTLKHFAANNQEYNRMNSNSCLSERALREIYLKGFQICLREATPHSVMSSYNLINGTHTSETRGLVTDFLRAENGWTGLVMTDWVIGAMTNPKAKYRGARSDKVAEAGGDIFMPGGKREYRAVLKALKDGSLTRHQAEVNASHVARKARELRAV
jgi:beta-glucosidase